MIGDYPIATIIARTIDAIAVGILGLTLAQVLPPVASVTTTAWTVYRIRESRLNTKLIQAQLDALRRNQSSEN